MRSYALNIVRPVRGYPGICREACPALTAKRHYCRLAAWHLGAHESYPGRWLNGSRTVTPHPRRRR